MVQNSVLNLKKNFLNAFSTLILQILLIGNITEITPSDILAVPQDLQ